MSNYGDECINFVFALTMSVIRAESACNKQLQVHSAGQQKEMYEENARTLTVTVTVLFASSSTVTMCVLRY